MTATHIVLARSERPKNFADVIGQENVVRALTHSFSQGKIHHAYLFTGTRGVGKTTLSRIIAKCLNCEQGISANPCGECSNCLEIAAGNFVDLYEVDAASNTRVEDMRELLAKSQYAPAKGRYKVFLIDEVHMLSNHSFNALLKTLEEPPEHLQFILATTEPEKLPATIISRCLHFRLQPIALEEIAQHMQEILCAHNISYVDEAVRILAVAAAGSMRDGLSLLDQAIAHGQGSLQLADVQRMLGLSDSAFITNIIKMLYAKDATGLQQLIDTMQQQGCRFTTALVQLQSALSRIALRQFMPEYDCSADEIALAQTIDPESVQLYYEIATQMQQNFSLHPSAKIGFSMAVLRMFAFTIDNTAVTANVVPKLTPTPKPAIEPVSLTKQPVVTAAAKADAPEFSVVKEQPASAVAASDWATICSNLDLAGAARAIAVHLKLIEQNVHVWHFSCSKAYMSLCSKGIISELEQAINNFMRINIKIAVKSDSQMDASAANISASQNLNHNARQAKKEMPQDVSIQAIMQRFDAEIVSE
jgi:DNA polymerase-3 subunit gamma/tau